jgi:glycosyltransferase involved in cell wall biosynthesis
MPENGDIRVLLYTDADYTGGAEKYLYYLTEHLPCRTDAVIDGEPGPVRLRDWLADAGLNFFELGGGPAAARMMKLFRLVRETAPDIVHINLPGPFNAHYSLAAPVARAAGAGGVVTTEHLPMVPPFYKSRILKRASTQFVDSVIAVSEDNRMHLTEKHGIPGDKIRVVYNGIPDPGFRKSTGKEARGQSGSIFRIAVIGSLIRKKGQKEAIEALAGLDDNIHLHLAGEGEMEGELRRLVDNSGMSGRVHFEGYVDDIYSFLERIDLLMVPASIEATPYTVLEAMASGVPVIANRIYGIPELIENGRTGILVSPDSMAGEVRSLYSDRELLRKLSERGRRRYEERFRIERTIKETMEIYCGTIRGGRCRN